MRYIKFLFYIFVLFCFFGCGSSGESSYEPTAKSSSEVVYTVGIHPYLNSQKTYLAYRPIMDYLEGRIDGVKFELVTSTDYSDYEKKLFSGAFDFALPNPYQTLKSIENGYSVIAKMKPDKVFRGVIVARKSVKLRDFWQLKGKTISAPAQTALAASMMPLYFLSENGLDVKKDIRVQFVGSQFSSIMNAYAGDTIAAATWPPPWEQWKRENPKLAEEMELVWETKPLINNGFVVKSSVSSEIAKSVADLLVELDKTKAGMEILSSAGFDGFEYATEKNYEPVKIFLREYENKIGTLN